MLLCSGIVAYYAAEYPLKMEGLYQGKKMGGTDGVCAPMLKHLLESMLEGELDNHLQESKGSDDPNRRNGKTRKIVRSLQSGEFELEGTRDRNGTFEPKIVPKRQLIITAELEDNVIAMYARGMSTGNISDYFASWLHLAPNNKKTGGKIISKRTQAGKNKLADALRHAANAIGNKKDGSLNHFFKRIAMRKGRVAAITATARK